jgi:glycosyltransferase 2 family protein
VLVAVTYFLLPQFADLPAIIRQIRGADWRWLAPILLCSALTYVGAALSLMGSVPERLRPGPTAAAQLGSSFASKLAPASVGGMALNVRYLQRSGVDPAVAVAGVGLNSLGGIVMHVVLTLLFIVWAGRSAFGSVKLPEPEYLLIGGAAVLLLAVGSLAVPAVRHLLATKAVPVLRRSGHAVGAAVRRPSKLALLLGGSLLVTGSYLASTFFATRAFDGRLSLAAVGAIYLAGSAVASAAPTPGGLGALEAALVAGLVAAGMANTIAVPAVFLYRLATFWLPILPGWLCFTWLKRRHYL